MKNKHPDVGQPILRLRRYAVDAKASLPGARPQSCHWRVASPTGQWQDRVTSPMDTKSTTATAGSSPRDLPDSPDSPQSFDDRFVVEVDGEDEGEDADVDEDKDNDNDSREDGRDSEDRDAEVSSTQNNAAVADPYDFEDDSSDNGVDEGDPAPSTFPPKRRKIVHLAFHPSPSRAKTEPQSKIASCSFGCKRSFLTEKQRISHEDYRHPRYIRYYGCKLCDHVTPYPGYIPHHLRNKHNKHVPKYSRLFKNKFVYIIEWLNPDRRSHRRSLSRAQVVEFNNKMRSRSGFLG